MQHSSVCHSSLGSRWKHYACFQEFRGDVQVRPILTLLFDPERKIQGAAKKLVHAPREFFPLVPHEKKNFFIKKSTSKRKEKILMGDQRKKFPGSVYQFFCRTLYDLLPPSCQNNILPHIWQRIPGCKSRAHTSLNIQL
jgi:hypothetical protein